MNGEVAVEGEIATKRAGRSSVKLTDTADLVHILEGKAEGELHGALGLTHLIEGLDEDRALVPGDVGGALQHVVTVETRDGDEVDGVLGVVELVADLLEVGADLLLDLVVTSLRPAAAKGRGGRK
jgi:hypothetical protein